MEKSVSCLPDSLYEMMKRSFIYVCLIEMKSADRLENLLLSKGKTLVFYGFFDEGFLISGFDNILRRLDL